MARHTQDEEIMATTTNLCAWGTSRAVRIPKKMCEEAGMEIGAALDMVLFRDAMGPYIVARPKEREHRHCDAPYLSIEEIFAGYTGDYVPHEIDWGEPVGAEIIE